MRQLQIFDFSAVHWTALRQIAASQVSDTALFGLSHPRESGIVCAVMKLDALKLASLGDTDITKEYAWQLFFRSFVSRARAAGISSQLAAVYFRDYINCCIDSACLDWVSFTSG